MNEATSEATILNALVFNDQREYENGSTPGVLVPNRRLSPQGHFRFYGRAKLFLKTRSARRRLLDRIQLQRAGKETSI